MAVVLDWMTLDWLRGCVWGTNWSIDTGVESTDDGIPVPGGGKFWLLAVLLLLLELPLDSEWVDVANATTDVTAEDGIFVTTLDRCWSCDGCCWVCCWWSMDEEIVETTAVAPVFLSGDMVLVGSDESNLSHY